MPDKRNLRVSHEDRDQVAEQLRVAAGDGRLTAEELDERLEAALTARTYGELEVLLIDLPASPAAVPAPAPEAKELVHLKINHGNIRRDGRWAVPRRMTVEGRHGNVVIDFSNAIISRPTLDLSISAGHGNVTLIVPPGVAVDVDNVTIGHGNIRQRVHRESGIPVKLLVTASGEMLHGNLVVRGSRTRRTFWAWLLRRRPLPPGNSNRHRGEILVSAWTGVGVVIQLRLDRREGMTTPVKQPDDTIPSDLPRISRHRRHDRRCPRHGQSQHFIGHATGIAGSRGASPRADRHPLTTYGRPGIS